MEYTSEEYEAIAAIGDAMEAVQNLRPGGFLRHNHEELVGAIHVLQSFVKQHVLNRLDPEMWSDWWSE